MSSLLNSLKFNLFSAPLPKEERAKILKTIYDEHQAYVRTTLYWVVGEELLDDAVQETFIKIWKKIEQFDEKSNIKTWIYRIAVNSGISILRKKKRENKIRESYPDSIDENEKETDFLIAKLIEKVILNLEYKQRIVFVLFYKEELSVNEISRTLRIPEGTVKSRLYTGRENFKSELEKHGVKYEK